MNRDQVQRLLAALLVEIAHIPPEDICDEATIEDRLRMESVTLIEVQIALEDALNVEIDIIEVVSRNSLSGIVDYIVGLVD